MAPKNRKTEKAKNGAFIAVLWTIALLAAAFALLYLSSYLSAYLFPRGMMFEVLDDFFTARLLLSLVNIVLISYLLFIHIKDYLALRAGFTLGILAFLFCFLLYAISSFPPVHAAMEPREFGEFGRPMMLGGVGGLGIFSFVPMIFTAVALLVFVKISSE